MLRSSSDAGISQLCRTVCLDGHLGVRCLAAWCVGHPACHLFDLPSLRNTLPYLACCPSRLSHPKPIRPRHPSERWGISVGERCGPVREIPAFAGMTERGEVAVSYLSLIARQLSAPCSPAKAGAQTGSPPSRGNMVRILASPRRATTPAEAGAQLGEDHGCGHRFVTAAIPIGLRPSPGWLLCFALICFALARSGAGAI